MVYSTNTSIDDLKDAMGKLIGMLFIALFALYMLVSHLVLSVLFAFIPSADLPRASDGSFLVTLDNYDDWTTHARIFDSNVEAAYINGDLVMRSIPVAEATCNGIDHCDNYESEFYRAKMARVILINSTDDLSITSYVENALNAIATHNKTVIANGFDFESSFQLPELEGLDYVEVRVKNYEDASNELRVCRLNGRGSCEEEERNEFSARSTKKALEMCRKNGSGCEIEARVEYSFWGFDFTEVKIIERD